MRYAWSTLALACLLASCNAVSLSPADKATADAAFDEVAHSRGGVPGPHAGPELRTPQAQAELVNLVKLIPAEPPRGRRAVSWNSTIWTNRPKQEYIREEYDYGDRLALVQTYLSWPKVGGDWRLTGINFNIATRKELRANDFTLTGKSMAQIAFLMAAIASPLLMIAALVKVTRTKNLKRKWLWGALSFGGLFSFQMNWYSGQVVANWLTVQLLDAGVARGGSAFDAWVVTMTAPVGAVLILSGVWANPKSSRQSKPPEETFA